MRYSCCFGFSARRGLFFRMRTRDRDVHVGGCGTAARGVSLKVAADAIALRANGGSAVTAAWAACSARATRFSRGLGPLTQAMRRSYSAASESQQLAVEQLSRSATRLTRLGGDGVGNRSAGSCCPLALVIAFQWATTRSVVEHGGDAGCWAPLLYILLLWSAIAIGAAVAIVAGYVGFGSLGQAWSRGCRHLEPEHCSRWLRKR